MTMRLSPREVYRRQMYKKFKKYLDLLKEIVKIKLTLISIFFIFFCSLFLITINEVKAACTSSFGVCNTCITSPNFNLKAVACAVPQYMALDNEQTKRTNI